MKKTIVLLLLITAGLMVSTQSMEAPEDGYKGKHPVEHFMNNLKNNSFDGEPMNIHTKDTPMKKVIGLIAKRSGLNFLFDPDVELSNIGVINSNFKNVPWDLVFCYLIFKEGLKIRGENNFDGKLAFIRVSTNETVQKEKNGIIVDFSKYQR